MIDFVVHLVNKGLAYGTVSAYIHKIVRYFNNVMGADVELGFAIKMVLAGARRVLPAPAIKPLISAEELRTIIAPLKASCSDQLVLRTALLMAFAGAWRVSQYTATPWTHGTIRWADVQFVGSLEAPTHVLINLRHTKTLQPGAGPPQESWFGRVPDCPALCPVTHMVALRTAAIARGACGPNDFVFTRPDRQPLTSRQVNAYLRQRSIGTGIGGGRLTSHCLRKSGATAFAMTGAPARALARLGGWVLNSPSMERIYLHDTKTAVGAHTHSIMANTKHQMSRGTSAAVPVT